MDTPTSSSPVAIAFVCAMPMELRPLARKLALHKTNIGGVPVRAGSLNGRDVVAIVTGMGTRLAREATARLLDEISAERVVVVGITGALDDVTPIGTLVLPELVIDAVTGTEHRPTPLAGGTAHGKMWTSGELITGPDVLADLRAGGVVSLDMETAGIAEECEGRDIPWSVFRVISDRAGDGSVDEEVFHLSRQDGTPNGPAIVRYFVKHPGRIPRMMRLARGATRAADVAAEAAIRACSQMETDASG